MPRFVFVLVSILCASAVGTWSQGITSGESIQHSNSAQVDASNTSSLRAILDVLQKANLSGSIEFSGHCESLKNQAFPGVPRIRAPKANKGTAIETLKEMFAGDPMMQVTQDADGTIRMVERGTSVDILRVRIGHVSFDSSMDGAYNANSVLDAMLASKNMKRFMRSNAIQWPFVYEAGSAIFPAESTPPPVPHVDTSLETETLSDALDRVLRVFPGIWLYENCPASKTRNRMVYFRFYHLQDTVNGTVVE